MQNPSEMLHYKQAGLPETALGASASFACLYPLLCYLLPLYSLFFLFF